MNFTDVVDRLCYALSPAWGAKRMATRKVYERSEKAFARSWEAADTDRLRGHKWMTSKLSIDSALEADLESLRRRSVDLCRSDKWASSALESRVTQVVGTGLRAQAQIRAEDDPRAETLNREAEAAFVAWSAHAGFNGETLHELQSLAERSFARDGETFLLLTDDETAEGIPLRIQVIAAERVETPPEFSANPKVRLGVEQDELGRTVAYHVRTTDPGDTLNVSFKFDRIPVVDELGRPRIIHLFERHYAGQRRGFPWFAPVMTTLKDLKDYDEAELISNQVGACFTAFVHTENPYEMAQGSLNSKRMQELSPGAVTYLGTAEKITMAAPSNPGGGYMPYVMWHLMGVAAGLNWPFAWLVKDYSKASFSSGRLAEIEGGTHVRRRQQALKDSMLCVIWNRFIEEAVTTGEISLTARQYQLNPRAYQRHAWIVPGRPWIDPLKEVSASTAALDRNLTTLAAELGARGLDLEETLRQRAREKELEKELGITPIVPGATGITSANIDAPTDDTEDDAETPIPD